MMARFILLLRRLLNSRRPYRVHLIVCSADRLRLSLRTHSQQSRQPHENRRVCLIASNNAAVANKEEQTASYGGCRTGRDGRWLTFFTCQRDPISIRRFAASDSLGRHTRVPIEKFSFVMK